MKIPKLGVLLGVLGLIFVVLVVTRKQVEPFGQILGAAGPYQKQYVQCLNECQKEDPNDRLGHNNLTCGYYCDAVITEMSNQGIPPKDVELDDNLLQCSQECAKHSTYDTTRRDYQKCVSGCYGAKEVSQWCKELWCPYSRFPQDLCMNMCTSSNGANNNQNAWKWGRFG